MTKKATSCEYKYIVVPTAQLMRWGVPCNSEKDGRKCAFDHPMPCTVLQYVTDIIHFVEKKENPNDQF